LDEILDSQRSPNDKSGLGYNKEEIGTPMKLDVGPSFVKGEDMSDASPSFVKGEDMSDAGISFIKGEVRSDTVPSLVKGEERYDTGASFVKGESKPDVDPSCSKNERNTTIFRISDQRIHQEATHTPQRKFRREAHSRMNQRGRYGSVFNGKLFSFDEYGHKALDCRHNGRKKVGRFNNSVRCWNCNLVGNIVAHCYTMRCYSCGGFGYKSQDYWKSRRQSMRNASYNTKRRVNETWKTNEVEIIEDQRKKVKKP
jgi:hypothetical protein